MKSKAQKIYDAIRRIPEGKVSTYGRIAEYIGEPNSSRVVGKVLHCNPDPTTIKCHRIVFKDGSLSSGFAFGGIEKQAQLLIKEGIEIDTHKYKVKNLEKYLMKFE